MIEDRPLLGISLMLGFCILAPVADAMAKVLGASVPLGQVVLVRFAIQVVLLIPFIWLTGRAWRMRGAILWYTVLRTVLHVLGIAAMFTGLQYLPLADAVAIVFVMPFIMFVLGKLFLSEDVGARRLTACLFGFAGTLLVINPSFAAIGWPALLPLFVAFDFSLFMLVTRRIAKETDPISLQAVSGAMAVVMILPALWLGTKFDVIPLTVIASDGFNWTLMIGIGVMGTMAHLLMSWSLRYAPSTMLAPMQYLEIPFATVLGFLIFNEWPNTQAAIGIALIMAAGIYVIFRERAIAAAAAPQPAA